jgi:hypothetical protein
MRALLKEAKKNKDNQGIDPVSAAGGVAVGGAGASYMMSGDSGMDISNSSSIDSVSMPDARDTNNNANTNNSSVDLDPVGEAGDVVSGDIEDAAPDSDVGTFSESGDVDLDSTKTTTTLGTAGSSSSGGWADDLAEGASKAKSSILGGAKSLASSAKGLIT